MHLDEKVLFVHNPRTSGTSIRRALLHGKDPNAELQFPAGLPDMGKHAFPSQIRKKMDVNAFVPPGTWDRVFKFSIVRNPWDRLVSLYGLFRRPLDEDMKARSAHARIPIKLRKYANQFEHPSIHPLMSKGHMTRVVIEALKLDFKDWLKFCDDYSWQGCPYLGVRPMTRIPQVRWFEGLDYVFRFEDREEINQFLKGRGYDIPGIENTTVHRPSGSYYNAETYNLVGDIFKEDIERFGYS